MGAFDGLVIGGGHNALTCAAYLARAGARIAVVEGTEQIGGGTDTRELTAPGYWHNSCANFFIGFDASPVFHDLELSNYGFDFVVPPVQQSYLFSDGRALVVHDELERTLASIARFSKRDADAFRALHERYERMRGLFVASLHNPPGEGAGLAASAVSEGLLPAETVEELGHLRSVTPYEAIDESFEGEHLRILFKKLLHVVQGTNARGFGAMFPAMFTNLRRMCMPMGGSRKFADALAGVVREQGGQILTGRHAKEVLVEDGRVKGVVLEDNEVLEVDEFVVSAIDFPQTLDLVGPDHFSGEVRAKAEEWNWTDAYSLVTLHLALNEPPRYKAEEFDADVQRAYNVSFGADNTRELDLALKELEGGGFPQRMVGNGACNSLFDPSYAPEGQHVAFWWPFAGYEVDGSASNWDEHREEYSARILECWREYAPNLTEDNLVASYLWTPLDVARNNLSMRYGSVRMGPYTPDQSGSKRPHPDLADYRVPSVEGLYHCGSTSPNGGGVNGAPGYNAAGVIADDRGFDRWWPAMSVERAQVLAGD